MMSNEKAKRLNTMWPEVNALLEGNDAANRVLDGGDDHIGGTSAMRILLDDETIDIPDRARELLEEMDRIWNEPEE